MFLFSFLKVDVDNVENAVDYWQLRKDRGYNYEDTVEICEKLMSKEEYEAKVSIR